MLVNQLSNLIIKPAIEDLILYSDNALTLLLFTACVESDGGTYIKQIKGPALGIYQMEPDTYNDIWENYIKKNSSLMVRLITNFNLVNMPSEDRLIYDLRFATAMARLHYARVTESLPDKNNMDAIYTYYKKYYNTLYGFADKAVTIKKFNNWMLV